MPTLLHRLRAYIIGVPLGLATWACVLIMISFLPPAGRPVAVYALGGTKAGLDAVVAAEGTVLEVRANAVVAVSGDPGFVARLYTKAPLIVVLTDAGGGCGFGFTRDAAIRQ
jgi:hypothetical protein